MISYTQFYLKEANLAQIEPLQLSIDKLLDDNKVNKAPIRQWFSTQYIKWFKSSQDDAQKPVRPHTYTQDEPSWMSGEGIVDFAGFEQDDIEEINELIKYFDSLEEIELAKIYKEPFGDQLLNKVKAWQEGEKAASKEVETSPANTFKEGVDYNVVRDTIPEGSLDVNGNLIPKGTPLVDGRNRPVRWVMLLSKEAYNYEGNTMKHCVKDYEPATPNQDIISLWDKQNVPHVTLEIKKKDKNIAQIKGNSNQAPKERYQQPTVDFIKSLLKKGYKVTGDGDNVNMNEYEGRFYFSDDPKWGIIYNEKIVPLQQSVFEQIKKRIVTVAGEGFSLVEYYLTNLQKGFRHV